MTTAKISPKKELSQKPKFTTLMFLIGAIVAIGYYLLGAYQFTDNGFVVQVSTPLAPRVSGVIKEVHVQNGQLIKTGDILVTLDPIEYQERLQGAVAQYEKARLAIPVMEKQIEVAEQKLKADLATLDTLNAQFRAKNHPDVRAGVPQIQMTELGNQIKVQKNTIDSTRLQIEADKLKIEVEKQAVLALKAAVESAQTSLKYTKVTAPVDGRVENVFLGIGSHVSPSAGMFTLINDGDVYVQANFEETNLSGVKAGDKASVYPRIYFGKKSFEGVVVANPFGVSRQTNNPFSGAPIVQTENKWLMLPQRLPVIIKITNPDKDYPLVNGMSTYVRIHD
ncbi:HlyD family secretion protein [Zwartia vadi]|uniref:HlyD family secretion protein n=1 Tax=Zwartia vadi TaxID=3058168 RepID=UPI0025B2A9B0|nr:HlyD family secretion protein [Zwartia vadi]MDN3986564.1 HlyD family secretion protein [Zwartia vadi]